MIPKANQTIAIGAALAFVNFTVGSAIVAPYNSTGYFFGIFTFINFILVVTIFKENNKVNELENKTLTPEFQSGKSPARNTSFYVVLIMLIVIFFDLFNELSGTLFISYLHLSL